MIYLLQVENGEVIMLGQEAAPGSGGLQIHPLRSGPWLGSHHHLGTLTTSHSRILEAGEDQIHTCTMAQESKSIYFRSYK